jgi:two-component system cell cycle sensor histidine kinase/response regulator CckA
MKNENDPAGKFVDLRKRAHVLLSESKDNISAMSPEDVKRLVHELDTYQIELELQNEDLRMAQEELDKSRKRHVDLYDFAPVGYLTISEKGLILEANLTAADMLGVEKGYLLRQILSSFIIDEDQDILYRCRKKLLETKQPQTCDLRMRKKDGSVFYAQLKSKVSFDLDGSLGQFRTVISDITEQKQLEYNLLQSKKEWEMTFDAMSDMVTLMDKDFRIVRANKAAHEFFKVQPGELNGQYCYELFRGESTPCQECTMDNIFHDNTRNCFKNIEYKNFGNIFQVTSAPIFDKKGKLQYIVHTVKDVTEIKRLQEELFQAHKMEAIGTLAGGIAHDFNNILSAILGYAEMVKADLPESRHIHNHINQVLNAGNRAKELVKQILTFSRKDNDHINMPLLPQHIVKEVLRMMRASLPTTIKIKKDIDPNCSAILAEPTQIHQIIVNLCTNAFHSIENEQGTIFVQLSNKTLGLEDIGPDQDLSPGSFVELVVKDTGCGMDSTVIDRIFEPYFTTKDVGKGSGIGLAVVHGIVKSYGGLIKVESEIGKGSTFRLYFPSTTEQKQEEEEKETEGIPSGTERILVVDDEDIITNFLKAILERLGYTVTSHTSSIEALEDFRSRPSEIDLVITDQTMPNMSGSELSKELFKVRYDIPIIICTGYSSVISENKAKEIGISRFATKPITITDLAKTVREVLDEKTSQTY